MPFSPDGCIPLPGPKDREIFEMRVGQPFAQQKLPRCPHTNPEAPPDDCIPDEPEPLKIVVTAVGPMGPCPDGPYPDFPEDCAQGPLGNEVFDNIPDVVA